MKEIMANNDPFPTLFAGGITIVLQNSIPILTSLILSVIGFYRKNNYRKTALILNILMIIYLIIPIGFIIATL